MNIDHLIEYYELKKKGSIELYNFYHTMEDKERESFHLAVIEMCNEIINDLEEMRNGL